jgi:hypothetical protein
MSYGDGLGRREPAYRGEPREDPRGLPLDRRAPGIPGMRDNYDVGREHT